MFASRGSSMRNPNLRESKAPRPEASIIARARTVRRSVVSASCTVVVIPPGSKATSRTRVRSWTSAPHDAAWRSNSSSNVARGTCQVCGAGTPGATPKSAYRSMLPSPNINVAPHL
jgi:hypothetical protein